MHSLWSADSHLDAIEGARPKGIDRSRLAQGIRVPRPAPEEVKALANAMWQLLDDMGPGGRTACPLSLAEARIAFEPFADYGTGGNEDIMTLEAAKRIAAEYP